LTTDDQVRPTAVFAVRPDANEDHIAQATWHAELAARRAAVAAGASEDELSRSFEGWGVVVVSTASGERYEAWVVTDPKVSSLFGTEVDPSGYRRPAQ
jgi:hypothetical protein